MTGLAPFTKYHYRIVAVRGAPARARRARTGRSRPSASRSACRSWRRRTRSARTRATTLAGQPVGHRQLQPAGRAAVEPVAVHRRASRTRPTSQVTDADGNFSFPVLAVAVQHAVPRADAAEPGASRARSWPSASPPKVTAHRKKVRNTARGAIYKFSGTHHARPRTARRSRSSGSAHGAVADDLGHAGAATRPGLLELLQARAAAPRAVASACSPASTTASTRRTSASTMRIKTIR